MSSEANKALAHRVYEAFNQRNLEVLDELCTSDFVYHLATMTIQGPEAYKQFLSKLLTAFPDLKVTLEDTIADGDTVVARYTLRGTHKGNYMGMPPTGKQITLTAIGITCIANGKAVEQWVNADDLGALQQLGVIPALSGLIFVAGLATGMGLIVLLRKVFK
ncbi:MAG TPA: ester cyclase [Ktedonobacteraceae bacterium]